MVVTKIERQKRRPQRVNIFVDGAFALGVHIDVLREHGLRKGDELKSKTLIALKSAEELQLAKQQALRFIGYRFRSEKELRAKLRDNQFHPEIIDNTISCLRDYGMVDDTRFACSFVKDTLMKKPAGRIFLQGQLRSKGIATETIQEVLDDLVPAGDEDMLALDAATKLMKRYRASRKEIDPDKQQARISGFLARRGFKWSTVHSVLRKLFNQTLDD